MRACGVGAYVGVAPEGAFHFLGEVLLAGSYFKTSGLWIGNWSLKICYWLSGSRRTTTTLAIRAANRYNRSESFCGIIPLVPNDKFSMTNAQSKLNISNHEINPLPVRGHESLFVQRSGRAGGRGRAESIGPR